MDKEINDLLDEIHADVQRYEQQQHQQQQPEDVDLELMFEMNEFVDQYSPHSSVASPLSPFYASFHFASIVVKVEYIFLIALNNVLVIHCLLYTSDAADE